MSIESAQLAAVSCGGIAHCVAVGSYVNTDDITRPLVLIKENDIWRSVTNLWQESSVWPVSLAAVDCVSTEFCVAVGSATNPYGTFGWQATYKSGEWHTEILDQPTSNTSLRAVSCASETFCLVGGHEYETVGGTRAAAYVLNGMTWQKVPKHEENFSNLYAIQDIECHQNRVCYVATGHAASQWSVTPTLAMYDADVWSFDANLTDAEQGVVQAVSCPGGVGCTVSLTALSGQDYIARQGTTPGEWTTLLPPEAVVQHQVDLRWESLFCKEIGQCLAVGYRGMTGASDYALIANEQEGWSLTSIQRPDAQYPQLRDVTCGSPTMCIAVGHDTGTDGELDPLVAEFDGTQWTAYSPALEEVPSPPLPDPETPGALTFVAFGDSLTTGGAIATCNPDRQVSPWGCTEKATIPYPDRIRAALGYSNDATYQRVGIWGYTAQEAVDDQRAGRNQEGEWLPQLDAIERADTLVVGALGVNDLHFSDVALWIRKYYQASDQVTTTAQTMLQDRSADFDKLFQSLSVAQANGATVILPLYYNPFDTSTRFCGDIENIGNRVVTALNNELTRRAEDAGFKVADIRSAFRDHGSGSQDSYVFGTQCKTTSAIAALLPRWLGGGGGMDAVTIAFDPHPNGTGTKVMAEVILEELHSDT